MRRRLTSFAAIGATLAALAVGGIGVLGASAQNEEKTTICHRTNSDTNPYVVNTPANEGVLNGHFEQHKGPIWEPGLKDQGIEWGDIIPPFPGHPEGLNWPEGEATLNNGCVPTNLPPTPPPPPPGPESAPPPPPGPTANAPSAPAPVAGVPRVTG